MSAKKLAGWPSATSANTPPPKLKGWNHSAQVLVFMEGSPEAGILSKFGIAYYHYNPPFQDHPVWVSHSEVDIMPSWWWPLPDEPKR